MEDPIYLESGPLRMSLLSEFVYFDRKDGSEPTRLGRVTDPDCIPPEYREDHENLLDRWRDATDYGRACEAEVHRSFSYGIDPARMN